MFKLWRCDFKGGHDKYLIAHFFRALSAQDAANMARSWCGNSAVTIHVTLEKDL